MKPKDLLRNILVGSLILNKRIFPVGSVILNLPSKEKELLSKLKSDDIKNEKI